MVKKSSTLRTHGKLFYDATRAKKFVDYADTTMTMWTLLESFEDFSQSLKEQSGKNKHFPAFTHPIAII